MRALTAAVFCLAAAAHAQEEVRDPEDEAPRAVAAPAAAAASFSGYFRSELQADTRLDNGRESAGEWHNVLFLRAAVAPAPGLRAVAAIRLHHFLAVQRNESAAPFLWVNGENPRGAFLAEPGEAFLEWSGAQGVVRAGLLEFGWGQNELGPADPLNPRDLRWGLPAEPAEAKAPVPAISYARVLGPIAGEAVLLPFFAPLRAWLVGYDFALFSPGGAGLPLDLHGLLPERMQDGLQPGVLSGVGPEPTPGNASLALRFSTRALGAHIDAGWLFGWDRVPEVHMDPKLGQLLVEAARPDPRLLVLSSLAAELYPRAAAGEVLASGEVRRQHLLFGDASWSAGDFVFKVDAAWASSQTFYASSAEQALYPVRAPAAALALGADYRVGERFTASLQGLWVHAGTHEPLFLWSRDTTLAALALGWEILPGRLDLRALAFLGFSQGDRILQPVLSWRFTPGWALSCGVSLWDGDARGPGGFFDRNDYGFVRLKISL